MPVDRPLSVVMVGSEALPFAKTGGLADVLGALPKALAALGHRVTLFVPRYRGVDAGEAVAEFDVSIGGRTLRPRFERHELGPGLRSILIDSPPLYDREFLYGVGNSDYPDNAVRFAFLAKAALQFMAASADPVDVIHAHDWQAGLIPAYLRQRYATDPVLGGVPVVMTLHNLAYQGLFPAEMLPSLDLGWDLFGVDGLEFWGRISYLKAGINFSTLVTTVSPTYAKEIQTPEYGFGFDGILRRRSADLRGILNGIDVEQWNPMTDRALPEPYGPADLGGKRTAKEALLAGFGLPHDAGALATPLVGMVSRMVDQKGFDLLSAVLPDLMRLDARFVLLGSGDPRYEEEWKTAATNRPDKVGARIGFDERLAHLIEGGSDIFLMPSRFEPCGLNQMYSLRYGTVPVVRAVGGLEDSVENYRAGSGGTGFKFRGYTGRALMRGLRCALQVYGEADRWRALQLAAMSRDHSWGRSAREYVKVYSSARDRSAGARGNLAGT